jgi:hypothetical protein
MPNPVGINSYVTNFFSPSNLYLGVSHSINNVGGFQEFATLAERNAIPLTPNSASAQPYNGFTLNDDKWSSGRRKVGMLVYVLENQKFYQLIPVGYFGNGGDLGENDWDLAPEWERAVRIDPSNGYVNEAASPANGFNPGNGTAADLGISADANSCWVELELGGDNVYTSGLNDTIEMTEGHGGIPAGTTVADLTNNKTYDELFDAILFPTSYPTVNPSNSAGLTDSINNLQVIGSVIPTATLVTSANKGAIVLNGSVQGPYAGDVTAAEISGPTGTLALTTNAPTDIADFTFENYVVTLGSNQWNLTVTFAQGPMPLDSTGSDYTDIRYAGGDRTASTSFEGVYPIKLGTPVGDWSNRALVSHSANNIECSQAWPEPSDASVRHRIAISDAQINNRTVIIQQWNPVAGAYADLPPGEFTPSAGTFDVEGNTVNYTVFTKASAPGGGDVGNNELYRIKFQ